jgi:glycosyltransferase involved in cell wall biosynthesis
LTGGVEYASPSSQVESAEKAWLPPAPGSVTPQIARGIRLLGTVAWSDRAEETLGRLQVVVRILQANSLDVGGGAAKVARSLMESYRALGHHSWMIVGVKHTTDPDVYTIRHGPAAHGWERPWWYLHDRLRPRSGRAARAAKAAAVLASPRKVIDERMGVENFDFPGTRQLLGATPELADIVHLHNLHGDYFDLRELQPLSRALPVVVTLHDPWMFTGHCAYFLDCTRWQHGCGSCPYPEVYPAVHRDSTDRNWLRKREIYRNSSLFVAAPSKWLLERAEVSILSEGIVTTRLIPNGVNLSIFRPGEKESARQRTGLPQGERILLFSGFSPDKSSFKDLPTLRAATEILGNNPGSDHVTMVVLGQGGEVRRTGGVTIRFAEYETDEAKVASFYQASDVYVHAARVGGENHSLAVLEALACGVPVVATAVGGIPEQVSAYASPSEGGNGSKSDIPTGILTPPSDPKALAEALTFLIEHSSLLRTMGANAARDARLRFDLQTQVDAYLEWYEEIIEEHGQRATA